MDKLLFGLGPTRWCIAGAAAIAAAWVAIRLQGLERAWSDGLVLTLAIMPGTVLLFAIFGLFSATESGPRAALAHHAKRLGSGGLGLLVVSFTAHVMAVGHLQHANARWAGLLLVGIAAVAAMAISILICWVGLRRSRPV